MAAEARLLKALPAAFAAVYFMNTAAGCFGASVAAFSFMGGLSAMSVAFLLLSSATFGFCAWHRVPLYYCVAEDLLNWADMRFRLPLDDLSFLSVHLAVTSVASVTTVLLYERCHKKPARRGR